MEEMIIHGNKRLSGTVTISGAKNSIVALIPATVLANTPVKFIKVPDILDVHNLMLILESMNVESKFVNQTITINPTKIKDVKLTNKAVTSLRASYYFMGALLGRFGHAVVKMPGGDNFGSRPIDQHLKAFKVMGAHIEKRHNCMILTTKNGLHGGIVNLAMVSVGATINTILAATKAHGTTVINNAAKEPEIIDLIKFLNGMGAKITGAGTHHIRVQGVKVLRAHHQHRVISDRIEAGTYIALAAAIGKGIRIKNVTPQYLTSFLKILEKAGVKLKINQHSIYVPEVKHVKPVKIITHPFPGYATDLQQPITPLLLRANGASVIKDTIYPGRNDHVAQLVKMGANIHCNAKKEIVIEPTKQLHGNHIKAGEIRAGATAVIAGLMAQGTTVISHADNVLRGYDDVIGKLTSLGAIIELVNSKD